MRMGPGMCRRDRKTSSRRQFIRPGDRWHVPLLFHVTHLDPRVYDTEGVDLADRAAAWAEATRACGEMIKDMDGGLPLGSEWKMEVADEAGPIFEFRFGARECRTA